MTYRALLRPGRLELHVGLALPTLEEQQHLVRHLSASIRRNIESQVDTAGVLPADADAASLWRARIALEAVRALGEVEAQLFGLLLSHPAATSIHDDYW